MKNTKKIFMFPERLNGVSILGLIALYIALFAVLIVVWVPKFDYQEKLNYTHKFANENVAAYLMLSTSVSRDAQGQVTQKQTIGAYFENNTQAINPSSTEEYKINYEVSGLTNEGKMDYMYSGSRDSFTTLPTTHTLRTNSLVNGGYEKLFLKLRYYKVNPDTKEPVIFPYTFSEEIITMSEKEARSITSNTKKYADIISFSYSVSKASDSDQYDIYSNIQVELPGVLYHLDYQTFVVTEDGSVYPLLGYYGVSLASKKPLTYEASKFPINMKPKYIVVKAYITDYNKTTKALYYKEAIENITR